MTDQVLLYICGGLGAAFYGFPVYVSLRRKGDEDALAMFLFAIVVGAIFGGIVTPFIGHKVSWAVDPSPCPLAIAVGLLANPLLPKIVEKGTSIFNSLGFGGNKS